MNPELQSYYERRLSMMGDDAWNDLMNDVTDMYEATNRLENIPDEKTLYFRRGEISIMKWMLSLKGMSEEAYHQLLDEDKDVPNAA